MLSTIITSLITSFIVSLLTFTIGLRTGKNQADRPKLKETYRKLAVHFEDLKTSIDVGRPKTWDNFDKSLRESLPNSQSWEYLPIVRAMKRDGTILDLPPALAQRLEELEKDLMDYGYSYHQHAFNAGTILMEFIKRQALQPGESSIHGARFGKVGEGTSSTEVYVGKLFIDGEAKKIENRLESNPNLGLKLSAHIDDKKFSVLLYPEGFSIPLSLVVSNAHASLLEQPEIIKLLQRKQRLLQQVAGITRKLTQYTNDPHPFWQTVFSAFRDVFR